jgi:hypothetical protein
MRLLFKILSLPFILITWVLYGVCRLIVLISGMILGILAGLALIAAIALLVKVGFMAGAAALTVAFLISPYGIPKLAAWLTGKLGGLNYALRDFVTS